MSTTHPRYFKVREASLELQRASIEVREKYQLTFIEYAMILSEMLDSAGKHALRAERHPSEPDTPADQA